MPAGCIWIRGSARIHDGARELALQSEIRFARSLDVAIFLLLPSNRLTNSGAPYLQISLLAVEHGYRYPSVYSSRTLHSSRGGSRCMGTWCFRTAVTERWRPLVDYPHE